MGADVCMIIAKPFVVYPVGRVEDVIIKIEGEPMGDAALLKQYPK